MSYLKQPAAGLVRLALDRWHIRGMRADNISAVVILLESAENLNPSTPSVTGSNCRVVHRPKDVLHRVSTGRKPQLRLRTVLGKICRLRAQRNNLLGSGVCVVRSPLGTCNRLSAARPATVDGVSARRPLRRRSYREACSDAADTAGQRQLRVLVRRISTGSSQYGANPQNDNSDTGGSDRCDLQTSNANLPSCDDSALEESSSCDYRCSIANVPRSDGIASEESDMRLSGEEDGCDTESREVDVPLSDNIPSEKSGMRLRSEEDFEESKDGDEEPDSVPFTSTAAETDDDGWQVSDWQHSTIDLCSPSAIDQHLPTAIECVSA